MTASKHDESPMLTSYFSVGVSGWSGWQSWNRTEFIEQEVKNSDSLLWWFGDRTVISLCVGLIWMSREVGCFVSSD